MLASALSRRFRRRRMERFVRELGITSDTRVLDVGGTPDNWDLSPVRPRLTLLNMPRAHDDLGAGTRWVAGDGRALPFADGAFDVVFSNSVIEHVGALPQQRCFADEVRRVGRSYWVQTPNRGFPIEQHLFTPLVHWLPENLRGKVVRRFTVWSVVTRPTADRRKFYVEHFLKDIHLLCGAELSGLFPEARIVRERFCGWSKSLIAVCGRQAGSAS